MSVKTRITELNARLAQKLTIKNVTAQASETTTELINKVDDIPLGINPDWTNWSGFNYENSRADLVAKLKYSDTANGTDFTAMFAMCSSITSIPLFDTSNATIFTSIATSCAALISVPQFTTSKLIVLDNAFAGCSKLETIPQMDFSKVTSAGSAFANCRALKSLPEMNFSNCGNFTSIFGWCVSLVTIAKLNMTNVTSVSNAFTNCRSLVNLTMDGTIKANGLILQGCTKLSKASITSVINALLDSATGKSITFSQTAVNTAFETSSGAGDGSTSQEWLDLIATKSNWTISLN